MNKENTLNNLVSLNLRISALKVIFIFLFLFLMALSSQIKIYLPYTPVPITMQTFVLFLSCIFIGKKAFIIYIFYALGGLIGINWYAFNFTSLSLIGPTGGYIIGFALGEYIGGYTFEKMNFRKISNYFIFFLSVILPVYILGLIQLSFFIKTNILNLLKLGVFPFFFEDLLKFIILIPLIKYVKR